jgi:membrane protein
VFSESALRDRYRRLKAWWSHDIWTAIHADPSRPRLERFGILVARSIYIVGTGFRTERIKLRAALLTYVTLLSIVPAIVVVFSLFAAFTGLGDVQAGLKRFIVTSLAVGRQENVLEYLDRFVSQAGAIGGFGVAFLFITMISLISNIERALNDIWGLRRDRSLFQRFQVYWPLITIGPVMVGASLSLTAAIETSDAVQRMVLLQPVFDLVFSLLPIIFTWSFLTLTYMFLPNTAVPFKAAVIGGIVAGTLWEAAKRLYAVYAGYALDAPSVYGSLAAVPLFVLWLYVSWVVALLGATLTFAVQNARTYEPETEQMRKKSQRDREFLAARLLVAVSDSFDRGAGPIPAQQLLDMFIVSPRFARRVLQELVAAGLLVETMQREGEDVAYVPGRPLHTLSIADVIKAMRAGSDETKGDLTLKADDQLGRRVCDSLLQAEKAVESALGRTTLAEILAETRSEEAART